MLTYTTSAQVILLSRFQNSPIILDSKHECTAWALFCPPFISASSYFQDNTAGFKNLKSIYTYEAKLTLDTCLAI